jgi:anaerobic ribonucleoside-triphosphate reductase
MTEANVKAGYELAEKELKDRQVQEVKKIVLKTLEKIKDQEKIRDEASKKVKILKMDIDDLKEGKIERIVERQEKDDEAKNTSVVIIIRETVNNYSPWYVPYRVVWQEPIPYYPISPINWMSTTTGNTAGSLTTTNSSSYNAYATINCSTAKDSTIGAYDVEGTIVNLR